MFGDVGFDGKIKANCRLRVRFCLHIAVGDCHDASRGGFFTSPFFFNAVMRGARILACFRAAPAQVPRMSNDESADLRLRVGKIRDRGSNAARRPRSFVAQVMKAVTKAKGAGVTPASMPSEGRRSDSGRGHSGSWSRPRKGKCCRIGRGQAAVDRLKLAAEGRGPGERMRRVVVKARIIRLRVGSKGADAHLRYLQRDGTDRKGERGRLYGAEGRDEISGREFLERGRGDRHQFRFIVAPEDGDRLSDLRAFTRDVMAQMEEDLGSKLDWVAVDHFNTGHPHSHVVLRGKDERGKDLIIAQDYITDGIRLRAQERATLELGPETDLELRPKLQAEVSAERFTRIDRAMLAEAGGGTLDLRPEAERSAPTSIATCASAGSRRSPAMASPWRPSPACGNCRSSWSLH